MKKNLDDIRQRIDAIDERLIKLLNQRAKLGQQIAEVKKRDGGPVYHPGRENDILARVAERNNGPLPDDALQNIYREIFSATRAVERELKVASLGAEGSYSHLASLKLFGHSAVHLHEPSFDDVFDAVEKGRADYAVVPVENSIDGPIGQTLDLLANTPLTIYAEYCLPITLTAMGRVDRVGDAKTLYTHFAPRAQARKWIGAHLAGVKVVETSSSSEAASRAAKDPTGIAIGSVEVAALHGMNILAEGIEESSGNQTRFFVMSRTAPPKGRRTKPRWSSRPTTNPERFTTFSAPSPPEGSTCRKSFLAPIGRDVGSIASLSTSTAPPTTRLLRHPSKKWPRPPVVSKSSAPTRPQTTGDRVTEPLFSRALIAGVGLIGGSLALVAKEAGLIGTTVGYGRNRETLERAKALGLVDEIATDPVEACRGVDLVFVATPVESVVPLIATLAPHLPDGCVVTDGGSVKGAIVEQVASLPKRFRFVGGHPVAGTEKSGPDAAFAELYRDHYTILTPTGETDADALTKVTRLWEGVGARVVTMTPADHDKALAVISHLPHLAAYALVETLDEEDADGIIAPFVAGGFKSATRIAASSPEMWRDIFSMNRTATLEAVAMFRRQLDRFATAIEEERHDDLLAMLERVRRLKRNLDKDRS